MGAALRTVVGTAGTSASSNTVWTATTTLGSAVSMIQVTNILSTNVTVSIRINPSGSWNMLASGLILPPNTSLGILSGTLNIQFSGAIGIYSNTASAVDYVISSLDYS